MFVRFAVGCSAGTGFQVSFSGGVKAAVAAPSDDDIE
ncbi:hypothetical protein EVAR_81281_1, partial [Eumeta japonica]